jgi:hypothetical protein
MTPSRAYALWPAGIAGRRALCWAAFSIAALIALWACNALQGSSLRPVAPSALAAHASLAQLPASARGPISAAIGADGPAFRVRPAGRGAFRAVSGPQRLRASFDSGGVTLGSGSAAVGLRLRAAGYGGLLRPLAGVAPRAEANRVSYAHGGLSEWYVNGPLGVEQGFTVFRRPATAADTSLELSVAVSGDARATLHGGREVVLHAQDGQTLRYGELSASDATGRRLPSRIVLRDGAILLRVQTARARFPLTVDPLIEQEERPVPSGEQGEGRFGFSIALSADGTTALVGAPGDGGFSGAAWVFTRTGSTWAQQGPRLTAPGQPAEPEEAQCGEEANQCGFGRSVALSADGSTALVGAPRANEARGAAWVFTRAGSTWSQFGERLTGSIEANGDRSFGRSVALSADGSTALVGAPRDTSLRGAAWAFARSESGFVQQGGAITGAEEIGGGYFGRSVSLSADGTTALIGARKDNAGIGAAWVFARSGSAWAQQGPKVTAEQEVGEGQFGYSVALSGDGDTAVIGGPHDGGSVGAAWILARSGTTWTQSKQLAGEAEPGVGLFGTGVAVSSDGATALVGAPREARRLGGVWALLGTAPLPLPLPPGPSIDSSTGSAAPATTQSSTTTTARGGVLGSATSVLPPPILARTGNVVRLSGVVRVKLPGSSTFTLLSAGEQIPFGAIVDATHGKVSVTTADAHGGTQTMVFYEGEFKLTQRRSGLVVSILFGGDFSGCSTVPGAKHAARASATKGKRTVRKLWSEGHGSYSTKGNYATGAVLGTRWLTADLCEGTLIRVLTDKVAVTNLLTGRRLTVTAGHSYLARAKRRHR